MTYPTKAALPDLDDDRAVYGLRGQLRMLAAEEGRPVDWSTLGTRATVVSACRTRFGEAPLFIGYLSGTEVGSSGGWTTGGLR